MHLHHHQHRQCEKEQRLSFVTINGGLDELHNLQSEIGSKGSEFSTWKEKTEGADDMFKYFGSQKMREIKEEDLKAYIQDVLAKNDNLSDAHIASQLLVHYKTLEDKEKTPQDKIAAEEKIHTMLKLLQERNAVLQTANEERRQLRASKDIESSLTGLTFDTAKKGIGEIMKGWNKASGKEKAMIAAGAAILLYTAIGILKRNEGLKKALGYTLGAYVTALGVESVVKDTTGRHFGDLLESASSSGPGHLVEDKETRQRNKQLSEVLSKLKNMNIPIDQFDEIPTDQTAKYAFGIANLSALNAGEFAELYTAAKEGGGTIPNDMEHYPRSPFRDDALTPAERFLLVKDMGEALGIVEDGDVVEMDDLQKSLSILHLSLEASDRAA